MSFDPSYYGGTTDGANFLSPDKNKIPAKWKAVLDKINSWDLQVKPHVSGYAEAAVTITKGAFFLYLEKRGGGQINWNTFYEEIKDELKGLEVMNMKQWFQRSSVMGHWHPGEGKPSEDDPHEWFIKATVTGTTVFVRNSYAVFFLNVLSKYYDKDGKRYRHDWHTINAARPF